MGSVAMDRVGNMALGYSVSDGTSVYPSIRYTGRLAGRSRRNDAPGGGTSSRRRRLEDRQRAVGRLRRHGRRPHGRLHLLVHHRVRRIGADEDRDDRSSPSAAASSPRPRRSASARACRRRTGSRSAGTTRRPPASRSTTSGAAPPRAAPTPRSRPSADTSPGVGGSGTYIYNDNTVSGGTRYYYVIQANDGVSCTSAYSAEVNALATGTLHLRADLRRARVGREPRPRRPAR